MTNCARLSPEVAAFFAAQAAVGVPDFSTLDIDTARAVARTSELASCGPSVTGSEVTNLSIPANGHALPARVYRPQEDPNETPRALPVLLWFHGGGFALGDLDSSDGICRSLAVAAQCLVISASYRLAPEHPWPAAHDDAWEALLWVRGAASRLGGDPCQLSIGGESAGGHLAAATALRARSLPGSTLSAQVLLYPVVGAAGRTRSYRTFATGYGLTAAQMSWFLRLYRVQGTCGTLPFSLDDVLDLSGAPPAYLVTAECDVLRDEAEGFAAALTAAGTPVIAVRYLGMPHGFAQMRAVTPISMAALHAVADALRATWEASTAFSTSPPDVRLSAACADGFARSDVRGTEGQRPHGSCRGGGFGPYCVGS